MVVIATIDFPVEISTQLGNMGLTEFIDYINFEEVQQQIISTYIRQKMPFILQKEVSLDQK